MPTVSVLTPTLDEEASIRDVVAGFRRQQFNGELELLVIDGGSGDRTREIIRAEAQADPRVRLLENPKRIIPAALNIGLREATGEFVARMDAHTIYPDDYLQRGVERLERGDVAWASGPQIAKGVDARTRRVALAQRTRLGIGGAAFRSAIRELEVDTGYTGVWRRDTLLAQGGWDERWPVNEDSELAARIRREGGRIVCVPEMAAEYIPRATLGRLARQYFRYGKYRAKTCRAHPASMRRSHLLPPALVVVGVGAVALPGVPVASRLMDAAVAAWVVALVGTAAAQMRTASARDAAEVPAVLATMHLSWGIGFLVGCARFGPPVRGVARLATGDARA
jgi:succinoglycan biosynthesis protein ExoA